MAKRKSEAWLTSALDDDSVTAAMVLAESLRRTRTTRTLAVIIVDSVSPKKRVALRKSFDGVFCLDDYLAWKHVGMDDTPAKIYAFSLVFFEKCVYLPPTAMVLENVDYLFEDKMEFKALRKKDNGSINLSFYKFQPREEAWEALSEFVSAQENLISERLLGQWLSNQSSEELNLGKIPKNMIARYSTKSGLLMTDKTHAPIIQLVVGAKNGMKLPARIKSLKEKNIGLREKLIAGVWLEIFHQQVGPVLESSALDGKPSVMMLNPTAGDDDKYVNEPIAIIGMSCRYPGANSVEEFWNMLYEGREGVREPPAFRWTKEHSLRVSQQERKTNAGFLSTKVDEFDAKFFGVSPKEAAYMDPQARLLHEVMWESLEDSGIDPLSLYGSHTGIFTGSWMNDYKDIVQGSTEKDFFRTYMGNSIGAAAARLSFLLGLTGPSIATESGCSSAIVALDLAVKSLRNGETGLAMAGGVNLLLHPFTSNIMDYVIAPNGRCKTFDSNADGFGRAEGCGVLVLKRMSDALRDRDNIWAVIRGSAVSQEGLSRSLGTPTVHCEALAMQLALEDANISPERVSFVETHGTGTSVGDPMEVAAITKAYYSPSRTSPLVIGSVKTNVGHTESCSGITGIMKTILALQHELIPKHRNLDSLNPEIFLDSIPAMIPMEPVPWPKIKGKPRIAGVSSFGITGTDGHVIIQEAPDYELPKFVLGQERPKHLLKISGKSIEALDELLLKYENLFSERAENSKDGLFSDAAYSANVGRASFNHRVFIVAQDYQDAAQALQQKKYLQGEIRESESKQICFLFTGQGSQYQGMAKSLYDHSPIFRIHFDACDRILKEMYNLSIRQVLWESDFSSSKELSRTIYSQTSIFCVEYCLLRLWQSWGIQPDYVLGHSLGEFCAAVAAGVLEFQDALKLVAERSRLIDSLPRGSMLVIKASKHEVDKLMKSAGISLDFAAVNNPEQTVVAGDTEKVQRFLTCLKSQNVKAIILEASHAFHSRHMDPVLDKYRAVAETIKYKQGNGKVHYVSGMEGRTIEDFSELTADYWVRHTREKVSFIDACTALREMGCQDFLEIGPQPVLSSFVMMNNEDMQLNCMPSLRQKTDDWETLLYSLGKLYLLGYKVDWKGYDDPYARNKVSLPFHPFHKKLFWVECSNNNVTMIHPLIGHALNNASALNIFQNDLTLKSVPYVKDHCIGSRIVYPGAGFTEMCLAAGYCVANGLTETLDLPRRALRLQNVRIEAPLELKEEKSCRLQVLVELPESGGQEPVDREGFQVKVYHQNTSDLETEGKWVLHASSTFIPVASTRESMKRWNPDRIASIKSTAQSTSPDQFYKRVIDAGLKFGEAFRMVKRYWAVKQTDTNMEVDEIVTEMAIPSDFNKYLLHPLIIDAVFQSGILTKHRYQDSKLKVPVRVGQLTMFSGIETEEGMETPGSLYLHAWHENGNCFVFIATENYTPIALVEDVELLDTNVKTIESVLEQQTSSIPDAWEEVWKVIPSPFSTAVNLVDVEATFADPDVQEKLRGVSATPAEDVAVYLEIKKLLYLYIVNALLELGWNPTSKEVVTPKTMCEDLKILPEFQKLVRFYFTVLEEDGLLQKNEATCGIESWTVCSLCPPFDEIQLEMASLASALKESNAAVTIGIYEHISKSLSKILIGETSALALLFPLEEDKQHLSADIYYRQHPSRGDASVIFETLCRSIYQRTEAVNDPNKIYRLLEVGSGTGSLSQHLLEWLESIWGDRFEFYYTDISQSFLYKAEKRFEKFNKCIKYDIFNIEQSPLSQGIPLNYFDMVCATDVLHATRRLEESMVHIRQTLRPGGALIFTETIIQARDITFVFGLLDGYWRYQDFEWRQHHCCVSDEVWGKVLRRCGFESVQSTRSYVDQFSFLTALASPNVKVDSLSAGPDEEGEPKKEWVVFAEASNFEEVTSQVVNMLDASGSKVTCVLRTNDEVNESVLKKSVTTTRFRADDVDPGVIKSMVERDGIQGIIYMWAMDLNEKDQKNVSLPFMHIAKTLLGMRKPPQLYVFTKGVHAINEDTITCHPTPATIFGMMKTLKNENYYMSLRCVDLDQDLSPAQQVDQMLFELAMNKGQKEQLRVQVAYRGNARFEPRFVQTSLRRNDDELKLPPSTDRYHLVLPKSKVIQDLEFDTLEEEQVGDEEVEIKIKAFALNFKDILTILKPSAEFEKLNTVGLDFAGIVTKAGASVKFSCGDRVFGANFKEAQLPSHLVVDSRSILKIPDSMTFWEAATLPAVFSTAYHCLVNIAKMKKGDTLLIHTGSGGVGLAAIQVAKHVGATIITTAGNARKRAYLRSLGIQHVFHSRNTSFEKDILKVTQGMGVNVVLNSITGPGIKEATLNSTAKNARFVEMSKLSTWTPEEVKAMRPDVDYTIVDLTVLERDAWGNLLDRMKEFLVEGHLKPIPYVKFDALNIRQALQYFQKAKHIGKVVCAMPEVTKQGGQFNVRVPLFNPESTYLITGGLGGIGFEVCKWMLGLGATDIMLTGRSQPKPEIASQIQELNDNGFNVMMTLGDIGDLTHCKAMINEIQMNRKPLRGVMHCAGVLRDTLFSNQTWESFQATFTPKVNGTWNLHELTRTLPLEHFVLYSSVTALMGTPGQANHVAANCFEDAFIHYRHSLGLPGTTINWGQWAQVGCAKEISLSGILPISVKRMLNGLETTLRTNKRQISFTEFDSLNNFQLLCPSSKGYLDDRLWKINSSSTQNNQSIKAEQFWKEMDEAETKTEKAVVFGGYLKIILRAALRLEADEAINDDANIQELGVDSLMMIELKNSIQSLLGSRIIVTASMLKNCNTVRLIANAVVGKLVENEEEEDVPMEPLSPPELMQLLQNDCVLDPSIQVEASTYSGVTPSQIKTVLVTGATGQLGPYVVSQLMTSFSSVTKIICLVRGAGDDTTTVTEKLKTTFNSMSLLADLDMSKLEIVPGDVALKNLALSQENYANLCSNVDAVIHCAVKSNYTEHYRCWENQKAADIRSVNVVGLLNILKFASTSKVKHIFYPSVAVSGVWDENDEGTLPDTWPQKSSLNSIVDNKLPGLYVSKFVCELLLEQANERGIPCKVFRFPWIAGESSTGRLNFLNNMYILRYLSFLMVNAMPSLPLPANILPVNVCAELSLKLFFNDASPCEIFNVSHPHPPVEQEFVQVAKDEFGKDLSIVEWKEFVQTLQEHDTQVEELKGLFKDQRQISMYMGDAVGFVKGYLASPDAFFKSKKVSTYIPNYYETIPPPMDTVRRDLRFLKSVGFLKKFGI